MIYAFRFVDSNGNPTGYYGIASARNRREMFWQIDQHGDPNSVQVKSLDDCSICFFAEIPDQDADEMIVVSEVELSEQIMDALLFGDKFLSVKWPEDVYGPIKEADDVR
jgi:hypothetical protein